MKNFRRLFAWLWTCLLLIVLSCSEQVDTQKKLGSHSNATLGNSDRVLTYILGLGFSKTNIVDAGKEYIVEGDIVFPKDMKLANGGKSGRVDQVYAGLLANVAHQVISVAIDPGLVNYTPEVTSALSLWNNSGSNVHFVLVTDDGTQNITIFNVDLGADTCGRAGFPNNGIPFNNVQINSAWVAGQSFGERMVNVAHELGHCIGFFHTNLPPGNYTDPDTGTNYNVVDVPGWGGSDASSIMNGGLCGSLQTVLSAHDIGAVKALYADPKPLNTSITITSTQFIASWSNPASAILSDTRGSVRVSYGGYSGTSISGAVTLPASANSYVIPGDPSAGSSGYISVTVTEQYASGGSAAGPTVSRNKSGGVWQ